MPAGYIRLWLPVFHIGYLKSTLVTLQCICKTCSAVLLPAEERRKFLKSLRRAVLPSAPLTPLPCSASLACREWPILAAGLTKWDLRMCGGRRSMLQSSSHEGITMELCVYGPSLQEPAAGAGAAREPGQARGGPL
jgi:hypothetical protein